MMMLRLAPRMAVSRAMPRALPVAAARAFSTTPVVEEEIIVPQLVETLEWTLSSPPPVHQFIEPPMVVEIAGIEPASSRDETTA